MEDIKQQLIMEKIQKLRLMDNDYMVKFFEGDTKCTELILRIILRQQGLQIKSVEIQKTIKSLVGRGVCLDVLAMDTDGKYYNIEIQRDREGADFRRVRYNSSLLDTYILGEGEKVKTIPDTYIIFITETDIFGKGYPLYEEVKSIKQTGEEIEDGAHVLFVNGAYRGNDDIGKLMADFCNPDAGSMNFELLKKRTTFLKEDEKGVSGMRELVYEVFGKEIAEAKAKAEAEGRAEGRAKALAEGRAEGEARGRITTVIADVRNMVIKLKMTADAAMDVLNIPPADRPAILAAL